MQKKVTLSVDSKVYEEFQKYCADNDIIVSKRVERIMKKEMEAITHRHRETWKDREGRKNEKKSN